MSLYVGLVDYIEAIFVAEFIKPFLLGVVAGAYGVYVVFFPKLEIFEHGLFGYIMAGERVMLVYVHTFDEYGLPVDQHLLFADEGLDLAAGEEIEAVRLVFRFILEI